MHVGLFEYIIFKIIKILFFANIFNKYLQLSRGFMKKNYILKTYTSFRKIRKKIACLNPRKKLKLMKISSML